MTAIELLGGLHELGVVVSSKDGRLIIDAPKGVITQAIRAELHTRKAELLAALEPAPTPAPMASEPAPGPGIPDKSPAAAIVAPPWAAELPIPLGEWPEFKARHDLGAVRLTWPEGARGLVVEIQC